MGQSPHVKMLFSVFILMFFLLPFNVVILAVWGRNLWANWRQPFSGDHDILPLLPILGLVQLGWAGYQPINRTM